MPIQATKVPIKASNSGTFCFCYIILFFCFFFFSSFSGMTFLRQCTNILDFGLLYGLYFFCYILVLGLAHYKKNLFLIFSYSAFWGVWIAWVYTSRLEWNKVGVYYLIWFIVFSLVPFVYFFSTPSLRAIKEKRAKIMGWVKRNSFLTGVSAYASWLTTLPRVGRWLYFYFFLVCLFCFLLCIAKTKFFYFFVFLFSWLLSLPLLYSLLI